MSFYTMVQGSLKHRRWMKKSLPVRLISMDREIVQYRRKEGGWHHVWDEEDKTVYAHHWLEHKPVIHKGKKPR
ncbi:hypothetical protein SEA_ATUIN_287 [Arthrobacter phage Atuin]|nr:hypothetical protein SEA_ATUIN_86 [Arthrobacter phage Atuin]